MKIHVIVHKAEEGGFWAEVPSIPGCATQGETMEEIETNIREAIEGCLSVEIQQPLPRFDATELIEAITPENLHPEIDWGAPVGKEVTSLF